MHYAEQLNRPRTLDGLHGLLNWLSAMQAAARMDGYQVEFFEDARDERVDRELDR
jgi:hypothetical protein